MPKTSQVRLALMFENNKLVDSYVKEPYDLEDLQISYSMTKSITGLLVGIAIDKGYLSLKDKVLHYFDGYQVDDYMADLEIEHLLTMTVGMAENNYVDLCQSDDWVKAFLEQDLSYKPGSYFLYSSHASMLLGRIIEMKSGISLEDFAYDYLFSKLDIHTLRWEKTAQGHTAGGMGLYLRPVDMMKIMSLFASEGRYNKEQIISKAYLLKAMQAHVRKDSEHGIEYKIHAGRHYGYQLHVGPNHIRFDGAFGQVCLMDKESKRIVLVYASGMNVEDIIKRVYINEPPEVIENKPIKSSLKGLYTFEGGRLIISDKVRLDWFIDLRFSFDTYSEFFTNHQGDLEVFKHKCKTMARWHKKDLLSLEVYFVETPCVMRIIVDFSLSRMTTEYLHTFHKEVFNFDIRRLHD